MKITYDLEVDILRIIFSNVSIKNSDEEKPGVILDDRGRLRLSLRERHSSLITSLRWQQK